MTSLVAITHPLTGKTYHMHPDLAAAKHHWIHPDPNVPTPPSSLPLFDLDALQRGLLSLIQERNQPTMQTALSGELHPQ